MKKVSIKVTPRVLASVSLLSTWALLSSISLNEIKPDPLEKAVVELCMKDLKVFLIECKKVIKNDR